MNDNLLEIIMKLLNIEASKDSLEIGTAGKGGCIKIYGNFSEPETFKKKIDTAVDMRCYAFTKMEKQNGAT
jgi:hypothetical protein